MKQFGSILKISLVTLQLAGFSIARADELKTWWPEVPQKETSKLGDNAQVEYLCKSKTGKQFLVLPQFGEIHEFNKKGKHKGHQDSLSVERTLIEGTPSQPEQQIQTFRHEEGDVVAVISEKAFTAKGPITMQFNNESLDCKKALLEEDSCFTQSSDREILELHLRISSKPSKFFVGEFVEGYKGELNLPLGNGGILVINQKNTNYAFLEQDDFAPLTKAITFNADHGMESIAISKECNSTEFALKSQFASFIQNVLDELGVETKRTKYLDLFSK